jgi:hypothetical protein
MTETPTPDEAQRALRDFDLQRGNTAEAGGWSPGWWIGGGIVVAALGIVFDLKPAILGEWGNTVTLTLLAVAALSTSRWGGRSVRVRQEPVGKRLALGLLGAVLAVALIVLSWKLDVPHFSAIIGVVGGLLMAIAGPWWQRRVLTRRAVRS